MPPRKNDLSESELDVLKTLWECQTATVRELHERLTAQGRRWAYTTVLTFLMRLESKGFVASEKSKVAHVFRPVVSRETLLRQKLVHLARELCDGASTPLMQALVEGSSFSPDEIQRFHRMLDDLELEPATKPTSAKPKRKR
ncbi:MAG: BlaI/MecI/CopY family transcriptional regulator [Planctomycetaceae bacterium]|nr:BlaI/MecI/CopY family transcriptional regulator [Planctomycetaceae bacterium]